MKNLLKSTFISLFLTFAAFVFIKSLINFKADTATFGLLIPSFSILTFFVLLYIRPVARTDRYLVLYTVLIISGLLVSLIIPIEMNIVCSAILVLGWAMYLFWYSVFEHRNYTTLQVGKKIPSLQFENINKETVSLSDFNGSFKVLLFYRGNWCPLCMAQIQEVVNAYKELAERHTDVLLISPQPHTFTEKLAKKYDVPFHFLVDQNNKAAKSLKIAHKNGLPMGLQVLGYTNDVVEPTVIIIDKDDKIIFADLTDNYRVRPEPATFLEIIDQHQV
ncbi:redoxin domain-containing protein [Tenacibaculum amylolyticum]|uniref:redoxin domain-containing protein n=1 Tax=Tenacibaculum amylolyticum TaxID=104269 RepID=UPI0038938522